MDKFLVRNSMLWCLIIFLSILIGSCSEQAYSPVNSNRGHRKSLLNSTQKQMIKQEKLYTLVASDNLLNRSNKFLSKIKHRPSTVNVRVGRLNTISTDLLKNNHTIALPVSSKKRFVVVGEKVVKRKKGYISWMGPLKNRSGWATLVIGTDGITGTLRTDSALYNFESLGNGFQSIARLNKNKIKPGHPLHDWVMGTNSQEMDSVKRMIKWANKQDKVSKLTAESSVPRIDVLVVYTNKAKNDVYNINKKIQNAVDQTNVALSNSNLYGSHPTINLVHSAQVNYDETGRNYDDHVNAMHDLNDGLMDNINSLRNQYLADIVVLFVKDRKQANNVVGEAYKILATSTTAFAAVDVFWATANFSFAHEVGHLFGARHNRAKDPHNNPFKYGHGYVAPDNSFHTIMAYGEGCGYCLRIQIYSTPDVTYSGQPVGTQEYENNAKVIRVTGRRLRDFRTLQNPTFFKITNRDAYGDHPHFTWTPNPEATLVHVYRCITTGMSCPLWRYKRIGYRTDGDEFTDYRVTIQNPWYPQPCQKRAIYYVTSQNRTGESGGSVFRRICVNGSL